MFVDLNKYTHFGNKSAVWAKATAIMEAFDRHPSAECVWWLDMDAIIMTPELDLYEYLLNPHVLQARLLTGQQLRSSPSISLKKVKLYTGEVSLLFAPLI